MTDLTEDEYQSLKTDIARRGIIIPIELDEEGNVLDGHHRLRAWNELKTEGIEQGDYPRVIRAGMTEAQKRNHIRALNVIRRHLTKEQRQEIWADMRADGMTYGAIAEATGVTKQAVQSAVVKNLTTQPAYVTGKDGKQYPAKKKKKKKKPPKPPEAPVVSIFTGTNSGEEKAKAKAQAIVETGSNADQEVYVTIFSSETNEYYTPAQYIEAAREVMGGIDLDPASHPIAQEVIKAGTYFTENDDGLSQEWHGRVWLNPPYGKIGNESSQGHWGNYLIKEYEEGKVSEAVLLVRSALGYEWFESLWDQLPVCFARERLSFIKSDGTNDGSSKQGTAFFYLGGNIERFIEVFAQFGRIILPESQR